MLLLLKVKLKDLNDKLNATYVFQLLSQYLSMDDEAYWDNAV